MKIETGCEGTKGSNMPTNTELSASGTTGRQGAADFKEFTVSFDGYSEDQTGLDSVISDYGVSALVSVINKQRGISAVNTERTRLTAGKREEKTQKANAFDEIQAARTPEEKQAILVKYGFA